MPYKVYQDGDQFCVHKMNADGSQGETIPGGCHPTKEKAAAHARAMYASENKDLAVDVLDQIKEITSDEGEDKLERAKAVIDEWESRIDPGDLDEEKAEEDADEKASQRADVSAADKKRAVGEYGDVKYADETNKKYPIDTEEHIRAAWNYIGQEKNQAKYSSSEVAGIKRKIIAAWKDKIDPAGPPSAKKKDVLGILDEFVDKVKSFFKDEPDDETGISVWKEGDTYWFLARYSNMFRDDDYPKREIITSDSHKRFVNLVKEGKAPLPTLRAWHKKSWTVGRALDVAYDDSGFAVAIGVFDAGRGDVAEALMKSKEPIRMSHGMPLSTIKRDPNDSSIIIEHETQEISFLPAWAAANKLTGFAVLNLESKEESMAIPDETKKKWISDLGIKPETLESLEAANTADANKAIEEGVEHKEVEEVAQPATPETTEAPVETPAQTVTPTADELKAIVQEAVAGIVSPLTERITTLEAGLKELKEIGEKRDEVLKGTPTASLSALLGNFAKSAIGDPDTKVDGRTELAKSKPKETAANVAKTGIPFIDNMLAGDNQ